MQGLVRRLPAVCRALHKTTRCRTLHATAGSRGGAAAKYGLRALGGAEAAAVESGLADYARPQGAAKAEQAKAEQAKAEQAQTEQAGADAVELTDSAIGRLRYLSEKRQATQYLRLRVDSGGCYGFSYMLDMAEKPEADDVVIDRGGAKMVIDSVSLPLVRGATIDWRDQLIGQAFYVKANPRASGGCGCGASFEIKMD
ncbi:[4Fe-4S] proteins maturation [Coemansia javaensis]|uniref:[4Fe-4S] proteins maturation n=1 Tax=Coemansia javaensis TaxID=2761396 RepID=A0A9W8HJG1_9FUNG|nr:[4Fe-4S] proteins maturation [Coemansia javaensis]